jgi:probable HAF family extracellular repeat protein
MCRQYCPAEPGTLIALDRRMTLSARAALFLAGVLLAATPVALHAQTPRAYHVEDLGTFGGKDVVGTAINIHGEIAGYAHLPDGTIQAFRWTRSGGLENLGAAAGATYSEGRGINDHGDVVGGAEFEFSYQLGFIAPRGGVMRHLWTPERQIRAVNVITNDGQMLGQAGESFTPFRTRKDGTFHDLGWPGRYGVATDINDAGDVVGWDWFGGGMAWKYSDTFTACRLIPCGKIMLGYLSGVFASQALSLNNDGVAVGWAAIGDGRPRAFRAQPGLPLEDLGAFGGGGSGADAINDAGIIVGWSGDQWPITAFVYTDTDGMIDLNTRVPASENAPVLQRAVAINEVGQIVALYQGEHGSRTVLLTPIVDTEPPLITSASVSTSMLQPPDGRMIPLTVSVSATDNMDPAPVCAIALVVSNEAPSGSDADIQYTGAFTLSLRASRQGAGDGRTYTITVRCTDDSGNASTADVLVLVPHDNR